MKTESTASRPFIVLDAPLLREAMTGLRNGGRTDPKLSDVDTKITSHLLEGLSRNAPQLAASLSAANDTLHCIQLGDQIFPIVFWSNQDKAEVKIYPPVPRRSLDFEALQNEDKGKPEPSSRRDFPRREWAGWSTPKRSLDQLITEIYGRGTLRAEPAMLYRRGDDVMLSFKNEKLGSGEYISSLYAAANIVVRAALAHAARPAEKVEKTGFWSSALGGKVERSMSGELRHLASSRVNGAAGAGPPSGLADDLTAVAVWRDRTVALTSQRGEGGATRLWVEDSLNGRSFYHEIPTPPELAAHGVAMAVAGDEVHLLGGVDADGKGVKTTWVYPLHAASMQGFPEALWRRGADLAQGSGWAVPAVVGHDVFVLGGVSGFEKREGSREPQVPIVQRGMHRLDSVRWLERAAPPVDIAGAQTASSKRTFVVGPGNRCDGRVYLCDASTREGTWFTLPQLPKQVGLGQVFFTEDKVIYAGGFDSAGKPSTDLYCLDMHSVSGRWEHLGESNYVAGKARLVRRNGNLASLMVTPNASRTFHLG